MDYHSWADKAAALASYAWQADDDTLQKHTMRIQAWATRRCGDLLKEFDARGGNRKSSEYQVGIKSDRADTLISKRQVAADAGMSKRQQATAVRVANVPEDSLKATVKSDTPPKLLRVVTRWLLEGWKTTSRRTSPSISH